MSKWGNRSTHCVKLALSSSSSLYRFFYSAFLTAWWSVNKCTFVPKRLNWTFCDSNSTARSSIVLADVIILFWSCFSSSKFSSFWYNGLAGCFKSFIFETLRGLSSFCDSGFLLLDAWTPIDLHFWIPNVFFKITCLLFLLFPTSLKWKTRFCCREIVEFLCSFMMKQSSIVEQSWWKLIYMAVG